jgi:hypothetical protein
MVEGDGHCADLGILAGEDVTEPDVNEQRGSPPLGATAAPSADRNQCRFGFQLPTPARG